MDRPRRRLLERQQVRQAGQTGQQRRPSSLGQGLRGSGKALTRPAPALQAIVQEALALARQRQGSGQLDEAHQLYGGILEIQPDHPDALLGLAQIAMHVGQAEAALAILARGIAAHPHLALFHAEHAAVLRHLQRLDEAAAGYRLAAALQPNEATTWNNLGTVLYEQGELSAAREAFEQAIALAPYYSRAHFGLAQTALMLGDLPRGYAEHEWRWRLPGYTSEGESFFRTFWDGSDLAGRTILLHDEQGFGDTIHYARYVPLVKAHGGRVILRCQPPLGRLLASVAGVDQLLSIVRGEPQPPFDVHAPLMSLPHLLGTTLDTIPASVPYLHARPDDVARWSARLADARSFKVGLVWAGSPLHANDSRRSLPLTTLGALEPLAQVGVSFYSLQKDAAAGTWAAPPPGLRLTDLGPDLTDFAETAAAVSQLDLVITVDTAVGHLAGALGRPAWVLLSSVHDARWMTGREDTPWYPQTRLFRQRHGEDWGSVLGRVREALTARLAAR